MTFFVESGVGLKNQAELAKRMVGEGESKPAEQRVPCFLAPQKDRSFCSRWGRRLAVTAALALGVGLLIAGLVLAFPAAPLAVAVIATAAVVVLGVSGGGSFVVLRYLESKWKAQAFEAAKHLNSEGSVCRKAEYGYLKSYIQSDCFARLSKKDRDFLSASFEEAQTASDSSDRDDSDPFSVSDS